MKNVKNKLYKELNIDFNLSEKFSYNFFPTPHFTFRKIKFLHLYKNFASIDEMKIYISINNFFKLNYKSLVRQKIHSFEELNVTIGFEDYRSYEDKEKRVQNYIREDSYKLFDL